jgi:shikimate dehydrogenase
MTHRVALLGQGIGYSASPAMHNAAFAALGLDWHYQLLDLVAEDLPGAVSDLRSGRLAGVNVTQPHKAAVLALLDGVTPAAARVDAVNTVVRNDGRLVGHNTDLPALVAELRALGRFRHAVVLGRGGAARSVAAVLTDDGARVELVGRDRWSLLRELLDDADLLVNATPIGTGGDDSPLPAELLRPGLAVLDLVYRPSPTRLVRDARQAGAPARGGAGVLLRQAALSFSLWTDTAAPLDAMRDALRAELGEATDA